MNDQVEAKPKKKAGRPPRGPITDTPEFKAALAAATAEAARAAVEQMRTELLASVAGRAPAGEPGSATDMMGQLALAIAEISDQGTSRKRVAPEVLAQRAEAHRRAIDLIVKARAEGLKPEYALVAQVYLNERLIQPFKADPVTKLPKRTEIYWSGMPNDAMRPINDIAKAIYSEFRASIGSVAEKIKGEDTRPMWVTAAGLVVKGDPPARRMVAADIPFEEGLGLKDQMDPTAPFVNVLGTIAPPAKQNVQQQPGAV